MFEPSTYQEKRATLNEILIQQLVGVVMSMNKLLSGVPALAQQSQMFSGRMSVMFEQYARGQQLLRDKEAERRLGPVIFEDGAKYANADLILDFLKANVGRTYFGTTEHTEAPDGCIATSGFHLKFKDWLAGLPEYDSSISREMLSGFYRDTMTAGPQAPIPVLVLRNGSELITVLFREYVSVMALNLDMVPSDYRWENTNHYSLRGEMYTYRNNMLEIDLEVQLAIALSGQGINALYTPKRVELERQSEPTNLVVEETTSPSHAFAPILWPPLEGENFDERFETAIGMIENPETSEEDRETIGLLVGNTLQTLLCKELSESVYNKMIRLNRARFGEIDFMSFEDWVTQHYEQFKSDVLAVNKSLTEGSTLDEKAAPSGEKHSPVITDKSLVGPGLAAPVTHSH